MYFTSVLIPSYSLTNVGPVVTPETPANLKDITVEDAEHDELVPYWNGMDIYEMMPLFIGGPDARLRWRDSISTH